MIYESRNWCINDVIFFSFFLFFLFFSFVVVVVVVVLLCFCFTVVWFRNNSAPFGAELMNFEMCLPNIKYFLGIKKGTTELFIANRGPVLLFVKEF